MTLGRQLEPVATDLRSEIDASDTTELFARATNIATVTNTPQSQLAHAVTHGAIGPLAREFGHDGARQLALRGAIESRVDRTSLS